MPYRNIDPSSRRFASSCSFGRVMIGSKPRSIAMPSATSADADDQGEVRQAGADQSRHRGPGEPHDPEHDQEAGGDRGGHRERSGDRCAGWTTGLVGRRGGARPLQAEEVRQVGRQHREAARVDRGDHAGGERERQVGVHRRVPVAHAGSRSCSSSNERSSSAVSSPEWVSTTVPSRVDEHGARQGDAAEHGEDLRPRVPGVAVGDAGLGRPSPCRRPRCRSRRCRRR